MRTPEAIRTDAQQTISPATPSTRIRHIRRPTAEPRGPRYEHLKKRWRLLQGCGASPYVRKIRRLLDIRQDPRAPTLRQASVRRGAAKRSSAPGCGPRLRRSPPVQSCRVQLLSAIGAAQESNLPSVGLRRRTGFEGLRIGVQLVTGAAFRRCFCTSWSS